MTEGSTASKLKWVFPLTRSLSPSSARGLFWLYTGIVLGYVLIISIFDNDSAFGSWPIVLTFLGFMTCMQLLIAVLNKLEDIHSQLEGEL